VIPWPDGWPVLSSWYFLQCHLADEAGVMQGLDDARLGGAKGRTPLANTVETTNEGQPTHIKLSVPKRLKCFRNFIIASATTN